MCILIEQLIRDGRTEAEINAAVRREAGVAEPRGSPRLARFSAYLRGLLDSYDAIAGSVAAAALQFDQAASSATSASTGLAVAVTCRDSVSAAARTAPAAAIAART